MVTYIVFGLVGAIAVVLGLAATKPDTFRVERSIRIAAPPSKVFESIDDFRRWTAWSPWEKLDPELKRTYGEKAAGVGATYAWEGNKKVGSGRMEITESSPATKIAIKLDFVAPFEAHDTAEFTIVPDGDASRVTWAMFGPNRFGNKVMTVFVSMDSLVGKDFETGLANMKTTVEA